jgi:hypothetical protein
VRSGAYYNIDFIVSRTQIESVSMVKDTQVLDMIEKRFYNDDILPNRADHMEWIFSTDFYKGNPVTLIDRLVMDYLENRALSNDDLNRVLESRFGWSDIDKFYYIPILIILIRAKISETYSVEIIYG